MDEKANESSFEKTKCKKRKNSEISQLNNSRLSIQTTNEQSKKKFKKNKSRNILMTNNPDEKYNEKNVLNLTLTDTLEIENNSASYNKNLENSLFVNENNRLNCQIYKNLYKDFFKNEEEPQSTEKHNNNNLISIKDNTNSIYSNIIFGNYENVNSYSELIESKYNTEAFMHESYFELLKIRDKNYMDRIQTIKPNMRSILLDWIMEVCVQFNFKRDTFHSSIVIFDIFMSLKIECDIERLQLYGISCCVIACKNEVNSKFKELFIIGDYTSNNGNV